MQYRITRVETGKSVIVDTNTTNKALVLWRAMKWSFLGAELGINLKGILGYLETDKASEFIFQVSRDFSTTDYRVRVTKIAHNKQIDNPVLL